MSAPSFPLIQTLEAHGADLSALKAHAARLIAEDDDGSLAAETEALAVAMPQSISSHTLASLYRALGAELIAQQKPAGEKLRAQRAEAIKKLHGGK